jgi:hypothetical protein
MELHRLTEDESRGPIDDTVQYQVAGEKLQYSEHEGAPQIHHSRFNDMKPSARSSPE